MADTGALRGRLRRWHEDRSLPDVEELRDILNKSRDTISQESPALRPRDRSNRPGGLIRLQNGITTVLVPDLHARTGFIAELIDMEIQGRPLLEAVDAGQAQVLCVGDGFHSEARGAERWMAAWGEYQEGFLVHEAMDEEMREGLALMAMVMTLKSSFPEAFHFLKGNHENVTNTDEEGNRPFGKYAWEGAMVRDWFLSFLGPDILDEWADYERLLPLLAVGDRFLVSHAEPRRVFSEEEIIDYREDDDVVYGLTWTANGEAESGSVEGMLDLYLGKASAGALYFGGHRPVGGLFSLRANGSYVQFHNPELYVVAVLEPGVDPDPERDIRIVTGR